MEPSSSSQSSAELYFLIAKFLEAGPCQEAAKKLVEEMGKHKLIPRRLDWEGGEHDQSFKELASRNSHIRPSHLLEVCKRLGPLLDRELQPSAPGIKSILGAGRQSLLRKAADLENPGVIRNIFSRQHFCSSFKPVKKNRSIVHSLYKMEAAGTICRRHTFSHFCSRMTLLNRALGHLTAVYCLLFDRSGRYVITGADDFLVKVWSVIDGRLLHTFRGASAEITDIAVNLENTILAAGSLDRLIRVWSLQTAYPIAVLSAHTGMITSLNFCPNAIDGVFFLVSTSTDGSIAFWNFTKGPDMTASFKPNALIFNERLRPGQAQMICASFSPGGMFLAAGSGDHYVRVYSMEGANPHRIMEIGKHSDRVDSIQWANRSLRFVSGSKDGTAIIWQYRAQEWSTTQLSMLQTLPGTTKEEDNKAKIRVTMVCWNADDSCVVTAANNHLLKIWDPDSGKLLNVLTAHKDEAYCLESHPLDPRILLSAGHDGVLIFWDLRTGEQLSSYQNHIEGQGNGAVFDAKWSPDGTMVAATDSHGHILLLGLSIHSERMRMMPKELFFHTDYRPLIRDSEHNVLDEQTEAPPHIMPPPFLVDIDGNPYPPELQRFVPGRENCSLDELIPNIIFTPRGFPEVVQGVEDEGNAGLLVEQALPPNQEIPERSVSRPNPPGRREGVEGVRHSAGNWQRDEMSWTQNLLVTPLSSSELFLARSRVEFCGTLENEEYEREKKRAREEPVVSVRTAQPTGRQRRRNHVHNYRTRAAREQEQQQENNAEENGDPSTSSNHDTSDATAHSEDMSSSSSDSSSSEYSDWIADNAVNLEPPKRSRRRRKPPAPPPQPSPAPPSTKPAVKRQPPPPQAVAPPSPTQPREIPELYRPSEWLAEVIPKKFPYYPQMGDEVMFFDQGYQLYLNAVRDKKMYQLTKSQYRPWGKLNLKEPELVKVIGIKYEIRPPRLCCLRLAVMRSNGRLTGERFTIRYHDIPDVIDFFILKQAYDTAMDRNWQIGDRFRSIIDDGWWWGTVEGRRPDSDSAFLCHRIRWDNGEVEDMSPWDMEPLDPAREPEPGGSVPVLPEEIAALLYRPRPDEWPGGDRDTACQRILCGIEDIMGLAIAEPFIAPVDINLYPTYSFIVEYPVDISTIKARFENRFYRRVTTAQFDIRYLATNAEKFNEPHSAIVKQARIVTDLCLHIIKEEALVDVPSLYRKLLESYQSSNSEGDDDEEPSTSKEASSASRSLRVLRRNQLNHQVDWKKECWALLETLWKCPDSEPFREPVDTLKHPDYEKVIDTPMDLSTIREELKGENYESPVEFCKDLRMMFTNSKNYNTNKRSKIYVMTVRLSAMAEEHLKRLMQSWKSCQRRRERGTTSSHRTRRRNVVSYQEKNSDSESDDQEQPSTSEYARTKSWSPKPSSNALTNGINHEAKGTLRTRLKVLPPLSTHSSSSSDDDGSTSKSTRSSRKRVNYAIRSSPESESDEETPVPNGMPEGPSPGHNKITSEHSYASNNTSSEEVEPFKNWSLNRKGTVRILRPVKRNHVVDDEDEANVENNKESGGTESSDSSSSSSSSATGESSEASEKHDPTVELSEEEDEDEDEDDAPRKNRKRARSDSSEYNPSPPTAYSKSRPRRNVKRRNYATSQNEESESDEGETSRGSRSRPRRRDSLESSSPESETTPQISVSSRGRIRKMTARARAFLRE